MSTLATVAVKHPSSTSNNMIMTNEGRVGIGTASPASPLHVVGEVTLASQVRFGAGSASTPAISVSGDTNTGLFFPTADTIAFAEGGTEVMRIDSSGNIGIGTSSPGVKLDVDGVIKSRAASGEGGQLELNNPDNASIGGQLDVSSADVTRWFTIRNNSLHQIGQLAGTGGVISLHTAANERMRITAAGDVGIGTTTPGSKLHVIGNLTVSGTITTGGASVATANRAIALALVFG